MKFLDPGTYQAVLVRDAGNDGAAVEVENFTAAAGDT